MSRFERFVAPAMTAPGGPWRIVATLVVCVATGFAASLILFALYFEFGRSAEGAPLVEAAQLLGIAAMIPALAWALRRLHGRRLGSLIEASGRLDLREAGVGAGLALAAAAVATVIAAVCGWLELTYAPQPDAGSVAALTMLAITPFQAAAEELVYRGYLMQQLRAMSRHPAIWLLAPALLFTLAHAAGMAPGAEGWRYLGHILLFGLFAGALVRLRGGLSAAIGFHTVNNLLALLVFQSDLSGLGLGPIRMATAPGGIAGWALVLVDLVVLAGLLLWVRRWDR